MHISRVVAVLMVIPMHGTEPVWKCAVASLGRACPSCRGRPEGLSLQAQEGLLSGRQDAHWPIPMQPLCNQPILKWTEIEVELHAGGAREERSLMYIDLNTR